MSADGPPLGDGLRAALGGSTAAFGFRAASVGVLP